MKTFVMTAGLLLTSSALLLSLAPTAAAQDFCALEDSYCVCVVNMPPGEGCGNGDDRTGCFVAVGTHRDAMTGVGCVN